MLLISVSDVAKAIQMAVNEATGRPPNENVMLVKEKDRPYTMTADTTWIRVN